MGFDIGGRRWLSVGSLLAAALAGGGCGGGGEKSPASTTSAPAQTTATAADDVAPARTLELESQLSTAPQSKDEAPGSQMVFTGMLFRPAGSSAIGRSQGSCTRTAPGRGAVFQCLLSFVLRDGAIFGQSVSGMGGPANGAVTGGIGSYRGARGTFTFKATGSPRVALTLRMTR